MNWLTNFVKPKLSALVKRKDVPENLWQNCPACANMIHHKDMLQNLNVCNNCNHHFKYCNYFFLVIMHNQYLES